MKTALWLALCLVCPRPSGGAQASSGKLQKVTVRPGDTLWSIAQTYLKDPTKWNEILSHNRLPSSDPTVALPGMSLKIPVALIKENLRAATLVYRVNRVLSRKKERAEWTNAELQAQLLRDDSLRTLSASRARVQFIEGDLLSLDENSMAILRPRNKDYDLELLTGAIQATQSKVVTPSARITPKTRDTSYSARVREDLSTRVEVYKGIAEVEGDGTRVEIKAGFATEVEVGRSPSRPSKVPELPQFEAKIGDGGGVSVLAGRAAGGIGYVRGAGGGPSEDISESLGAELKSLKVGIPIAAYRIQAARSRDFESVVFDRVYDADESIDVSKSKLAAGRYWWRVAVLDLLGAQGRYSLPREYAVGGVQAAIALPAFSALFEVTRPPEGGDVSKVSEYRVAGRAEPTVVVTVNGRKAVMDAEGYFSFDAVLRRGPNVFRITATDIRGNEREIERQAAFEP